MIALLGARFAPDNQIQDALQASLVLLRDHRAPGGAIPNNVDCATLRPNFRAYADGGLWWVIGSALLAPDPEVVREVLRWYEDQDVDQSGLLSMQESSDWQDLFCTRGKGLYLNCLYVLALRCAAELCSKVKKREPPAAAPHWSRTASIPISGTLATAIFCGTFRTPSAPKVRRSRIRWDVPVGCRRSGI